MPVPRPAAPLGPDARERARTTGSNRAAIRPSNRSTHERASMHADLSLACKPRIHT